jgi:hypothetical protein
MCTPATSTAEYAYENEHVARTVAGNPQPMIRHERHVLNFL